MSPKAIFPRESQSERSTSKGDVSAIFWMSGSRVGVTKRVVTFEPEEEI